MAAGYGWSIITMMATPFLLIGLVAFLVVRKIRQAEAARQQP